MSGPAIGSTAWNQAYIIAIERNVERSQIHHQNMVPPLTCGYAVTHDVTS